MNAKKQAGPAHKSQATWPDDPLRMRRVSQSGILTTERIAKLIAAGYGQGHGETYQPWLRVQKKELSPVSAMGHLPAPAYGHLHHYRSRLERDTLIMVQWLGAEDARDQFPMWPWPHRHPAFGLPGWDMAPEVAGMNEIADQAGIQLKAKIGSTVRSILTLDILSTWRDNKGYFLVAYSCKPMRPIAQTSRWRDLELLELARRYAKNCQIEHQIVSGTPGQRTLLVNLDRLRPTGRRQEIASMRRSKSYITMLRVFEDTGYADPINRVVGRVAASAGLDAVETYAMLNLALWTQDLDHDISLPLENWRPLTKGGIALRTQLRREWARRG